MRPRQYVAYPSVTQVIDWFYGDWKNYVEPEMLKKAQAEGIRMHEKLKSAFVEIARTGISCGDAEIAKAVQWYVKHRNMLGDIVMVEERIISDALGLSGKPDLVTDNAIIDWKRTTNKKLAQLQLAGYSILLEEEGIKHDAWIVYDLTKNRAYNLTDFRAKKKFAKMLREYQQTAYEY